MKYAVAKSAAILLVAGLVGACANPFTRIDDTTDASVRSKMDGSWTVMNMGGTRIEGMNPLPTIVFNTADRSVSGFDGCNDFRGTYAFDGKLMKAKVVGTRRACTSDVARSVSTRIADLFSGGSEVVEMRMFGANALMLKNANGDVRMGPTSVAQKK